MDVAQNLARGCVQVELQLLKDVHIHYHLTVSMNVRMSYSNVWNFYKGLDFIILHRVENSRK